MGMEGKIAPPGMENAHESDVRTEMPFVPCHLEQGVRTAAVEKIVQNLPVGKDERIKLRRDGEDCMEIRGIDHIGLPRINPFFLDHLHSRSYCNEVGSEMPNCS